MSFTLAAGKYALICNIPAHYSSGMWADFTVTEASDGTGTPAVPAIGSGGLRASEGSGGLPSVPVIAVSLAALALLIGGGTIVSAGRRAQPER